MNFKQKQLEYINLFESCLSSFEREYCSQSNTLKQSMFYSLNAGGKRLRPTLMFSICDSLGVDLEKVLPFALAIEMIHTYSLVHDDMPSLDNDVLRRGKPTTHVKFGEGIALLSGDGLLNLAVECALNSTFESDKIVKCLKVLLNSSGGNGMVAGQVLDLENEKNSVNDEKTLEIIYENKTCKLIIAPLVIGGIISNYTDLDLLTEFGKHYGYLFQLTDDALDVIGKEENLGKSIGKDENSDKLTAVKVYGIKGCIQRIEEECKICLSILDKLQFNCEFLKDLVLETKNREK